MIHDKVINLNSFAFRVTCLYTTVLNVSISDMFIEGKVRSPVSDPFLIFSHLKQSS